ncbi:hypothetical protein FM119_03255 [Mycetocola reblochoni REB411]|uniref:Uncharacterized protein n=1 Tax=Mycetocola reblochoni REB411 TaxID=1255698 RepID=A0A1R4IRR9_9MICO|nr:hypothetical protein FM119_03255 [Mycetocola reblochoni REB411]
MLSPWGGKTGSCVPGWREVGWGTRWPWGVRPGRGCPVVLACGGRWGHRPVMTSRDCGEQRTYRHLR